MAVKKVIRPEDLHHDDFVIEHNKVRVLKKLTQYKADFAADTNTITTNNVLDYENPNRRQLTVLDGMGKIHLDFKMVKNSGSKLALFRLPDNAPRCLELIETQTHDGSSVWLDAGGRIIYGNGLRAGQRYILDIIGFFE